MTAEQLAGDLLNGSPEQRASAAQTLSQLGAGAAPAAAALVNLAGDDASGEWCVATLEELGPPPASQVGELAKLTTADNEATAYWAATLLGRLGPAAAPATGALARQAAEHPSLAAKERAVWALGKIGPAAAGAKPVLESLTKSDPPRLARLANEAIKAIKN